MKNKQNFENLPKVVQDKLNEFEERTGSTVLYVTEYGSKLYGTDNPNSDTDFKGVFQQSKKSKLLGKSLDSYTFETGNDKTKNSKEDFDVGLHSTSKFYSLLRKGESGALGLLFSMFSDKMVFENKDFTDKMKKVHKQLLVSNVTSFMGYALGQMKKFSLKTDRLSELREFRAKLGNDFTGAELSAKVTEKLPLLREVCKGFKYFDVVKLKATRDSEAMYLKVFGKTFEETVSLEHLLNELERQEKSFGNRTKDNLDSNGNAPKTDLKGLSHALRMAFEGQELMATGFVTFPSPKRELVKEVKEGRFDDLEDTKSMVLDELEKVPLLALESELPLELDEDFLDELVLSSFDEFDSN